MPQGQYTWIDGCEIRRETDKAFEIYHSELDFCEWFPKSQLDAPENLGLGLHDVGFTNWILEQKGISP